MSRHYGSRPQQGAGKSPRRQGRLGEDRREGRSPQQAISSLHPLMQQADEWGLQNVSVYVRAGHWRRHDSQP